MKIKCDQSSLLNGLQIATKAVPSKTTMPILQCILIDASSDEIHLIANDMDLGIDTIIEGEIIEPGIVAVEAKFFLELIRKLSNFEVRIETNEKFETFVYYNDSHFKISGRSADEFTYLPQIQRFNPLLITQFTLKEIIRQTIFSIADNDTNKIMTGELFEVKDNVLKVVSLDGHRISIRKTPLKDEYEDKKVIVPGKTLNEISKILTGEADKDVNIYFEERHIIFEFDQTVIVSRLIEGEYFKIDQMISSDYETKVNINKKDFLNCIDRATLLVKEGQKKPILIDIRDGEIELKINSEIGNMNEKLPIDKEGKDMIIGFNPRFLIDALKVIDNEEVDLYMVNPKAPCYIRDRENTFLYLVLPVNISNS